MRGPGAGSSGYHQKLDLQGYDYKVLQGAKTALQSACVVLIEILFVEMYLGCHLFPDVLRLLGECGYTLYALCGLLYGNHDKVLWADAIILYSVLHGRVWPPKS